MKIERTPTRLAFSGLAQVRPIRLRIGAPPVGTLAICGEGLEVETDLTLGPAKQLRAALDELIADLERAETRGIAREPKPLHTDAARAVPQ